LIKAVFFDLDDTLLWDEKSVSDTFQYVCTTAEEQYGVDSKQLEEAVRQEARKLYESYETYPFTKMIGINPFEGLWANFSEIVHEQFGKLNQLAPVYRKDAWTNGLKAVGIDDAEFGEKLAELFHAERRKRPLVYEDTFEVLERLKQNYRLLLLTNGDPSLQKEKIASVSALSSYFEHIVISGEFGKGKPDPSIFEHALNLMGVQSNEVVMVGDKLSTDILGASRTNIRSVWINRKQLELSGEVTPDYEISQLRDLLTVLENLKKE